jgi:tetratricopeptide (TPR) repeat protein
MIDDGRRKTMAAGLWAVLAATFGLGAAPALAGPEESVAALQSEWEQIKYRQPADRQERAFEALAKKAAAVRSEFRDRADVDIWYAIVLASHAGAKGGLGALSLAKEAKVALEQAIARDPKALEGSAYTSLGSLYYQVPGWPIGFGDKDKARDLLGRALAISPRGIDPSFFMGDFLYRTGDYEGARRSLELALQAPARPARPLADEGRRREAEALLVLARQKLP